MLASMLQRAMKDRPKISIETIPINKASQEGDEGITSITKDISSQSELHGISRDNVKGLDSKTGDHLLLNGSSEATLTNQCTTADTAVYSAELNPAPNNLLNDSTNSPSTLLMMPKGFLSSPAGQLEKNVLRERPKDLLTLFKRNNELSSELPSQTNSPGLKIPLMKRSAAATMKRARDKIQVAKLFMNISKKPTDSTSTPQVDIPLIL